MPFFLGRSFSNSKGICHLPVLPRSLSDPLYLGPFSYLDNIKSNSFKKKNDYWHSLVLKSVQMRLSNLIPCLNFIGFRGQIPLPKDLWFAVTFIFRSLSMTLSRDVHGDKNCKG